ncbi:MAG: GDSL-type esterase/lipase family protein [Oscillospiraceae bacterium]|nr:GDSL-type esterase/lipase family protein [Oscillospiraceae bacterium]
MAKYNSRGRLGKGYGKAYGLSKKGYADKRKSAAVPVLISLVCIAAVSFGLAVLWHNMQQPGTVDFREPVQTLQELVAVPSQSVREIPAATQPATTGPAADTVSAAPNDTEGDADITDDPPNHEVNTPQPGDTTRFELFPTALAMTGPVDDSYFDDAIFFGDSISVGIPLYNVMPNAKVVAFTGINTVSAFTKPCIEVDGELLTMLDAAKGYGEKGKVYIMLGGNGLGYDKETFIAGYIKFLQAVGEQYPGAVIYIQSMTPVTDEAYRTYPSVSNERLTEYNIEIYNMAREQGVVFLDAASALMDEDGKLPVDASPVDGLHFTPEYYAKWFTFLRSHTAA